MEIGDKLKDLNMTVDEIDRLTKAFKDEKFREMLRDYAQELSDPENRKRYEEEIKLLEQERGNTIEFIHPQPFRALRTSVNGEQKCFINICGNDKVEKPASGWVVTEEGRRGQRWSLPHSLHPGRQDTDPKGNKIMIYDVIFHPDTLHIASKNKRFMDMVISTAIQGIQNAFKVTLDKNNVREMRTKYKGTPQPCVTRKPIPGYKPTAPSEEPDPLAFPYPDDNQPTASSHTEPTESCVTNSSDVEPNSFQIQPPKTKEPTKPKYTVKYRSFIDLQDFRCSRDSAQSPRPKEVVITVDMPLLKAATDASLEVKERRLLLESKNPAYRLELHLAYPVDEDKGEAKFNKQRGQLTVTLPVLPSNEGFDFTVGAAEASVSDDDRQEEISELEEDKWKERERLKSEEVVKDIDEEDLKHQTGVEQTEKWGESGQERGEEQMNGEEMSVKEEEEKQKQTQKSQDSSEEERVNEQKQENEKEVGKLNQQQTQQDGDKWMSKYNKQMEECGRQKKDSGGTSFHSNTVTEEEKSCVVSPETENEPVLTSAEDPSVKVKEGEVKMESCSRTSDIKEDTGKTKEARGGNQKVESDSQSQNKMGRSMSQRAEESSEMPATAEANMSSRGGSGNGATLCSDGLITGSLKEEGEDIDGDDLPPPVLLREIDEDGNETVISDHSTSAGFTFQNSLIFELD